MVVPSCVEFVVELTIIKDCSRRSRDLLNVLLSCLIDQITRARIECLDVAVFFVIWSGRSR